MQGESNNAVKQSERIQIRAFWISNKQTPYVYKYIKNKSFTNKGDMVFEIRDAITTGVVLNNFVPGLANFIGSLGDRLTLDKVISFIDLMTDQTESNKSLSDDEVEDIANRIQKKLFSGAQPNLGEAQAEVCPHNITGSTSGYKTTDLNKEKQCFTNEQNFKVEAFVTNQDKADSSQFLSISDTNSDNSLDEYLPNDKSEVANKQENQLDSNGSKEAVENGRRVKRNLQPLNQLGNLSK